MFEDNDVVGEMLAEEVGEDWNKLSAQQRIDLFEGRLV